MRNHHPCSHPGASDLDALAAVVLVLVAVQDLHGLLVLRLDDVALEDLLDELRAPQEGDDLQSFERRDGLLAWAAQAKRSHVIRREALSVDLSVIATFTLSR